jgi:hypothetical protein
MTVQRLLSEISSSELNDWIAFYQIEPFGCAADDMRAAIIASAAGNAYRFQKQGNKPWNVEDYIPNREPQEEPRQTKKEQMMMAEALAFGLGYGKFERGK